MFCKPAHAKPMVESFKLMVAATAKAGFKVNQRIMTDVAAERYWTVVMEMEVENLDIPDQIMKKVSENPEIQKTMKDYHDHIESGRREIYKLEN
jgi:hypothetical protein